MTKQLIICLTVLATVSCKKNYQCGCYSERKGFKYQVYSKNYKEKNNKTAVSKCHSDYKTTPDYSDDAYCLIE